jgi:octaprenyl-diphosphate synthase
MKHGTEAERSLVKACIEEGDESKFDAILSAITQSGALAYTKEQADQAASRAANAIITLPDSPYKQALQDLAYLAVNRNH